MADSPGRGHGRAHDHDHGHAHDHGHDVPVVVHSAYVPDHDHEPDDAPVPVEDDPVWQQDNVVLSSVGMDIGSSGTQVLFSRLHLRRMSQDLSTRYLVVRRQTVHRSPVALTPYADDDLIDAAALGAIIDRAYGEAGVEPDGVDTGVVILTGEALRRRNAEAISGVLAERGGTLVTATAGHHMEAMLAGFGSGAAQLSHDAGIRVLNVDTGGGTTKLSVLDGGRVVATAAVHIGGRLQVVDDDGRIVRLETAGRAHAARAGFDWSLGDRVTVEQVGTVAAGMADVLVSVVRRAFDADADPVDAPWLDLTEPLVGLGPVDGVLFSGGVAEYVYERESASFGDLGRPLGDALRERLAAGAFAMPLLPAGECIRATALGASEYSVQLSGNTGWISDPDVLLPRRDLQVVRPTYALADVVDAGAVAAAVRSHVAALGADPTDADVAVALTWSGVPSHARVHAFARGVRDGLADRIAAGRPLYLVLDGDVAMSLGRQLSAELDVAVPLFVVDGLALRDFDYVDLGRVRHPSRTVPVTIKSLVFGQGVRP